MRWWCLDGFGGGRFRGELDVRSRWEAGFCRFWTRGAFAGPVPWSAGTWAGPRLLCRVADSALEAALKMGFFMSRLSGLFPVLVLQIAAFCSRLSDAPDAAPLVPPSAVSVCYDIT